MHSERIGLVAADEQTAPAAQGEQAKRASSKKGTDRVAAFLTQYYYHCCRSGVGDDDAGNADKRGRRIAMKIARTVKRLTSTERGGREAIVDVREDDNYDNDAAPSKKYNGSGEEPAGAANKKGNNGGGGDDGDPDTMRAREEREPSLRNCCGVGRVLRSIFKDLKLLSMIMIVWLAIVILVMIEIGVFDNKTFVAWGPRDTLSFLHVPIDTSYKYGLLLVMIMFHTFISDFISDGLVPHLLNQLQDIRCRRLPHRHIVYYVVTTIYGLYAAVSQLFLIFLALGQLDLLLARLFSDLAANLVTTHFYLETKVYDPKAYRDMMAMDGSGGGIIVSHGDDDDDDDDNCIMHRNKSMHDNADSARNKINLNDMYTDDEDDDAYDDDAAAGRILARPVAQGAHAGRASSYLPPAARAQARASEHYPAASSDKADGLMSDAIELTEDLSPDDATPPLPLLPRAPN